MVTSHLRLIVVAPTALEKRRESRSTVDRSSSSPGSTRRGMGENPTPCSGTTRHTNEYGTSREAVGSAKTTWRFQRHGTLEQTGEGLRLIDRRSDQRITGTRDHGSRFAARSRCGSVMERLAAFDLLNVRRSSSATSGSRSVRKSAWRDDNKQRGRQSGAGQHVRNDDIEETRQPVQPHDRYWDGRHYL
jgi:hypothetical protein